MREVTAVFGASGILGGRIVAALDAAGRSVRAVTRKPSAHAARWGQAVELCAADLRDATSLARACQGVRTIVSTANGFGGRGTASPRCVDWRGNANLVEAARNAGVRRFVFVSAQPATADAPVDFFRYKFATEQLLIESGMTWVIVRPTAFADMWVELALAAADGDRPLPEIGSTPRPANFVAVADVVRYVLCAEADAAVRDRLIVVGGPENLTLRQLAERVALRIGRPVPVKRVPLMAARVAGSVLAPFATVLARQIRTGVMMATSDQSFDMAPVAREFGLAVTPLDDVIADVRDSPRSWSAN